MKDTKQTENAVEVKNTKAIEPEKSSDSFMISLIENVLKIPGVKVDRDVFLNIQFKDVPLEHRQKILDEGPVAAGCDKKELRKIANKLINDRTLFSTGASFLAGLPGGLAMAATIPADMAQYYAVALRLAQELAYLYGESDLWAGNQPDEEKVTNQLILYCGVMLGASDAAQTVRVVSSALAKQALNKLPKMALTKTFYYTITKSIAKWFGINMTKATFAKGVSKVLPIVGGIVSGGITFATMRPMGKRLADTLEEAHFSYTPESFKSDWDDIVEECTKEAEEIGKSPIDTIKRAKELLDCGAITEEEFETIKKKALSEA